MLFKLLCKETFNKRDINIKVEIFLSANITLNLN